MEAHDSKMWLHHKNPSVFTYNIVDGQDFRAIVISDLHIARFHLKSESIQSIFDHLRQVIDEKSANVLFICGDIIHFKISVRYYDWIEAYTKFEELGIEVHVIPGNHDRFRHKKVSENYKGTNVHLHPDDIIKIVPPNNGKPIFLSHEIHNDRRVHGTEKVRKWFRTLRSEFSDIIDPDSLLIVGHLHEDEVSEDGLTKSLMPYSLDLNVFFYGNLVLNSSNNNTFEVDFVYQEGSLDTLII